MRTSLSAESLTKAGVKAAEKRGLPEKLGQYQEAGRREKTQAYAQTATETVTAGKSNRTGLRKKNAV
jgi:hypothetical protein